MAIEIRMTMIDTTTISSTNVKPRTARAAGRLPRTVASPIGCLFHGFAVDVKDVLAAPALGLGVVLIAAHPPFALTGERVDRDTAEESHLLAAGAFGQFYAFHELV